MLKLIWLCLVILALYTLWILYGNWGDGKWGDKYPKVYLACKAGSVSMLNSHILHGSDDNNSKDRWRRCFLVQYQKFGKIQSPGTHMKREIIDVYN